MKLAGLKHRLSDTEWAQLRDDPFRHYPESALDELIDTTVAEVKRIARGKRVGFGWSGGKDSMAHTWVMHQAGIREGVLVLTDGLEHPAFETWAHDHLPDGVIVHRVPVGPQWLIERPHMLFPRGKHASSWFPKVQQAGQRRFFHDRGLDIISVGRRTIDGNYVGPNGTNLYTAKTTGVRKWSPIGHWPHEAVFGLMQRENLPLAPCYDWPRGFTVATGPWPARGGTVDDDQGWRETWAIDPGIVRDAAGWLPQARRWLETQEG